MISRRSLLTSAAALAGTAFLAPRAFAAEMRITLASHFQVTRFIDADTVEMIDGNARQVMKRGDVFDGGTLVEIIDGDFVIMEDFRTMDGDMLVVDMTGVRWRFGKTAESTAVNDSKSFMGHSEAEVRAGATDLLGGEILARPGDPDYETVAAVFPPIRKVWGDTYNFLGTPDNIDKVPFFHGGASRDFDPAVLVPAIQQARGNGQVRDGLVGGYLPCLRFVYPDKEAGGDWTELVAFAPFQAPDPGRQPVWYRVSRIEGGRLAWAKHVDSRLSSPSDAGDNPKAFYADLAAFKTGWDQRLAPGMKIDVPDMRVADMARHGLIRAMMAGPAHGVPEEETALAEAFGAWGLAAPTDFVGEAANGATLLGMPLAGDGQITGGPVAGLGRSLIGQDRIREALLLTWGASAHLCTRGGWMAVATRQPFSDEASAYSAVSQMIAPLMTRWLVAFEDTETEILWLGKAMPQAWLADSKLVFIDDIATRWGRVSFATDSRITKEHRIAAKVVFPSAGIAVATRLRLRTGQPIRGVTLNDKSWKTFDAASGTITLPAGMGGTVILEARY